MGSSLKAPPGRLWLALPGLFCLFLAASFLPAGAEEPRPGVEARPRADQVRELQDLIALAEKQVATKRAGVKVAEAQKRIADARLKSRKTKVAAAQAAETAAKAKRQRFKELVAAAAVPAQIAEEAEASFLAATAHRQECEENVLVAEGEVALEVARRELAQAELEEYELRLKQLRERLRSIK
jgi:membrane fusion protein (multidrug efflux system)